jgi:hypothetical protein
MDPRVKDVMEASIRTVEQDLTSMQEFVEAKMGKVL